MDVEKNMPSTAAEVIDELNDAVFDAAAWERVVTVIGNWSPEVRPLLHVETTEPARVVLAKYVGWDPQVVSLYANHYVEKNIFRRVIMNMKLDEVGVASNFLDRSEYLRSTFYNELLSKAGDIRNASGFTFARTRTRFAVLGFHYPRKHEETLTPIGVRFQNMIAPAARNAFALAVRAASLRRTEGIAETIDSLAIPALVLDTEGRLIRANRLCGPLIEAREVVRLSASGHLAATTPQDDERLRAAFSRAQTARQMVTCAYRSSAGRAVIAHFVPMRRTENTDPFIDGFVGGIDAAAIVYLRVDADAA